MPPQPVRAEGPEEGLEVEEVVRTGAGPLAVKLAIPDQLKGREAERALPTHLGLPLWQEVLSVESDQAS